MLANSFRATLFKAFSLLSRRDQRKVILIAGFQFFLALLDLISIALIGLTASLTLYGVQSKELPLRLQSLIGTLRLDAISFQSQVAILGLMAGFLLILKTLLSAYISRRILYFLNRKTAVITAELLSKVLSQPYDYVKTRAPADLLFAITRGVTALVAGVLGSVSQFITELSLLVVLSVGLFIFDPLITLFSAVFFGLVAYLQTRRFKVVALANQQESTRAVISSEGQILECLSLYRELHVRDARNPQIELLIRIRSEMADSSSRVQFLPYITKFSMEISLVVGAILLVFSQFLLNDSISAITTLSVFLTASTRVSPSILRLQQAVIQFQVSAGMSEQTMRLLEVLVNADSIDETQEKQAASAPRGQIIIKDVKFQYLDGSEFVVNGVSFEVLSGEMVAIVGPSGNGKSTLMDLMMGALIPLSGSITIDSLDPASFIRHYPGMLSFVAQESVFTNDSVRENLLIGLKNDKPNDVEIWKILERVGMKEAIASLPRQLDSSMGERGVALSAGQRQRLSIARALITKPKVLFLDEPTSALDHDSEGLITNLIKSLHGNTTVVVIAHRLETIKSADRVIRIVNGKIKRVESYTETIAESLSIHAQHSEQ